MSPMDPELEALLQRAREWYDNATEEEREAHFKAQRESWVRGEMGIGLDRDEVEYRVKMEGKRK